MKRILILIFACCCCFACVHKEAPVVVQPKAQPTIDSEVLHSWRICLRVLEKDSVLKNCPPNSDVVYTLEFRDSTLYPNFDTTIDFSYICAFSKLDGYKGYALVDGKVLAIYDSHDLGHQFYNKDSLLFIPEGALFKFLPPDTIRYGFTSVS